jgi:hypothetical protein
MYKTYFLEMEDRFDDIKFFFKFREPYVEVDIEGGSHTVIKQLLDLIKFYSRSLRGIYSIPFTFGIIIFLIFNKSKEPVTDISKNTATNDTNENSRI